VGKPLCIDLFCGLGGWAEGFLAEGYDVVGFDIERHDYGTGGYPGQLVLQDVLTLHGSQFKRAAVIVASPPCQAYSKRAMPFGGLWLEHNRMDDDGAPPGNYRGKDPIFNDLFRACFRIAAEAGRPIIVENVKGAQKFVGRAAWHFGSYYLWGDVPALMPFTGNALKVPGFNFHQHEKNGKGGSFQTAAVDGVKQRGSGAEWFDKALDERRKQAGVKVRGVRLSKVGFNVAAAQAYRAERLPMLHLGATRNDSRKAASAQIAKIPFPLAQHIAKVFKP
jgi:hypothetical protein